MTVRHVHVHLHDAFEESKHPREGGKFSAGNIKPGGEKKAAAQRKAAMSFNPNRSGPSVEEGKKNLPVLQEQMKKLEAEGTRQMTSKGFPPALIKKMDKLREQIDLHKQAARGDFEK